MTLSTADEAALPPLPPDPPYLSETPEVDEDGGEDEDEGSLTLSPHHISLVWAAGDGQGTDISEYVLQLRVAADNSWREVAMRVNESGEGNGYMFMFVHEYY